MTSKYIEIEMRPTACGIGGSFSTDASFCLDNFKAFKHGVSDFMIGGVNISSDKICFFLVQ